MTFQSETMNRKKSKAMRKHDIGDRVVCVRRGTHFLCSAVVIDIKRGNRQIENHPRSQMKYICKFENGDRMTLDSFDAQHLPAIVHRCKQFLREVGA